MGEPARYQIRDQHKLFDVPIHLEIGSKEARDRPIAIASSCIYAELIVKALNYFTEYPPGPRVAADLQASALVAPATALSADSGRVPGTERDRASGVLGEES